MYFAAGTTVLRNRSTWRELAHHRRRGQAPDQEAFPPPPGRFVRRTIALSAAHLCDPTHRRRICNSLSGTGGEGRLLTPKGIVLPPLDHPAGLPLPLLRD